MLSGTGTKSQLSLANGEGAGGGFSDLGGPRQNIGTGPCSVF